LAARLPRSEFLEPFLDEATAEPLKFVTHRFAMMKKMKDCQLTEADFDFDENACMAMIPEAIGKPSETAQQEDVPLSQAERDMYPCLLAMCGSGFAFFKVSDCIISLGHSTSSSMHFFTQSSSSFRSTCPYYGSLFCCNTNAISSMPSLSLPQLLTWKSVF